MYKLMIVDDEKTTRESLARYISWERCGIGSVRTAKNGAEALALAEEEPFDVLVTDVRMPRMDGIELAERVRERYPGCGIVFLSGYADKEYLKSAIQLQAICYIEKPIDPREVQRAVESAVAAQERAVAEKRETERLRERDRERMVLVREEILRALVRGASEGLIDSFAGAIPQFERNTCFTVAVIELRWIPSAGESEKAALRARILSACREHPPFTQASSLAAFVEPERCALMVAKGITDRTTACRAPLDSLLALVQGISSGAFAAWIGVGRPVNGLSNLSQSYGSAVAAGSLSFYREAWRVYFPSEGRTDRLAAETSLFLNFREQLLKKDSAEAGQLISRLAEAAREQEPLDVDSVRNAFFKLFLILFESAWERTTANPILDEEKGYIWEEVGERSSLSELTAFIEGYLEQCLDDSVKDEKLTRRVNEVQRYIRKHYAEADLSLATIAESTGLSRTYLCTLFKKATGSNVTDFVTSCRMTKARELLLDYRMKAQEVAALVGYRDANYFSAIFKKQVGCTPTEFRDKA